MTEITSDFVNQLGLTSYGAKTATENRDKLGQSDFLKLMTTQLSNQDPMAPMENGEFLGQMAQFSTVTGIESLTSEFGKLSLSLNQGQALQAAALVGKSVLIPAKSSDFTEGQTVTGAVDLPASAERVKVGVYDTSGQLIRTVDLGKLDAGIKDFAWDGLKDDGSQAPTGKYEIKITAEIAGKSGELTTLLNGQVKSVGYDSVTGGLMLNVQGLGNVGFSDVYRIG